MNNTILLLMFSIFLLALARTHGHGLLAFPNQRGTLASTQFSNGIDPNAPVDPKPHFPAGDKSTVPGAALLSQIQEAPPGGWTPFRPLEENFKWRASVCGDEKDKPQEHLRGGRFYYGAKIVATYKQGGILAAQINLISHHNGFFEFHVCDVSKCGGEISETCFRNGHCQQLRRASNPLCDKGDNPRCGPIDPSYPGRWYLPCSTMAYATNYGRESFGGNTVLYQLPSDLACEHCVLQWSWTTGHLCNAPGVLEYFHGPHGPNWGNCRGQGGAIGGVSRVQRPCGGDVFPEEYLQCADISIANIGTSSAAPSLTTTPRPSFGAGAVVSSKPHFTTTPSLTPTAAPTPSLGPTITPTPTYRPTFTPRPNPGFRTIETNSSTGRHT